jgi:SAM-dependent methyltransferase
VAAGVRWQDVAQGGGMMDELHPQRRVVGLHDIRFDGLSDLLLRARGCSVIDVGCNRGHVAYEFAINGARLVHGCDIDAPSIQAARIWFSELPHCQSRFEVVNLEKGPASLEVFGPGGYDIVLFLGTLHKLKRVMRPELLSSLIIDLGRRAHPYLAWSGYQVDLQLMDRELATIGMRRVHTSYLALPDKPYAIWKKQ